MKGYRKILIAVNDARHVLTQGLKLASDEKCWVTVVKVVPPHDGDLNLTGVKNIADVLNSGAEGVLAGIRKAADSERAFIKTRLEEGEVHDKIIEVAEDERCDLIVMGANKTNWFKRLLGRSVVEKVIAQAPCPVLVLDA